MRASLYHMWSEIVKREQLEKSNKTQKIFSYMKKYK